MIKTRDMQVFEILEEINKIPSSELQTQALKKYNDHQPLHYMLMLNYSDSIVSLLPEGIPPFNRDEEDGPAKASLWQYLKMFPRFVKSAQSNMKPLRREQMFIEMLEAIDINEATVVCHAKDGNLEELYPNLSVHTVIAAFPELNITTAEPVKEKTAEEKAAEVQAVIDFKKAAIKELQTEVKDLQKELKSIEA